MQVSQSLFLSHSGLATRNIPNITEECQFVRVPAITNDECNLSYKNDIIDDSMICSNSSREKNIASNTPGYGSCTGDEGGPYICNINICEFVKNNNI